MAHEKLFLKAFEYSLEKGRFGGVCALHSPVLCSSKPRAIYTSPSEQHRHATTQLTYATTKVRLLPKKSKFSSKHCLREVRRTVKRHSVHWHSVKRQNCIQIAKFIDMVLTAHKSIAPKCTNLNEVTKAEAVTSTSASARGCRRKIAFHPTLGYAITPPVAPKVARRNARERNR